MSKTIDEKVVEMRFDNKHFESSYCDNESSNSNASFKFSSDNSAIAALKS